MIVYRDGTERCMCDNCYRLLEVPEYPDDMRTAPAFCSQECREKFTPSEPAKELQA